MIGFCIFSIEDALHYLGFIFEWCIVLLYRIYIVCCGIYIEPSNGGTIQVNVHASAMDVNAKVSDQMTTNNHIITADVEFDYV